MSGWFSRAAYRASINDHLRLIGAPPATDAEFDVQAAAIVAAGLVRPYTRFGVAGFVVIEEGAAVTPLERGH